MQVIELNSWFYALIIKDTKQKEKGYIKNWLFYLNQEYKNSIGFTTTLDFQFINEKEIALIKFLHITQS